MAFTYTAINGQRVQTSVAAAFYNLAAAFKKQFGLDLLVTSGTRTRAEQQHLYNLYRAGKGNLAAAPGYSNHEETGPRGPRALDVRDSGGDAGVTVKGTTRANWLRANAPKFGFNPAGYGFKQIEPWHIEYTGALNNGGAPAPSGGSSGHTGNISLKQRQLNFLGFNVGAVDGKVGPKFVAGTLAFQKAFGLNPDGINGDGTGAKLTEQVKWVQERLQVWGENIGTHGADGNPGNNTISATKSFQTKAKITVDGIAGGGTRTQLAKNPSVAPVAPMGRNATSRPTKDIQNFLIKAGYDLGKWGADNDYRQATSNAVFKWQKANGLVADAIWGAESDKKAFGTATPNVPSPPVVSSATPRTPTLPFAARAWNSPKGKDKRDAGSVITHLAVHHTGSLASQENYFKSNTGSIPTWYVNGKEIIEFVPPEGRPITTAKANNYTVSIETQNITGAPSWEVSSASVESIAQIAAWLYSYNGKTLNGVPVKFELTKERIKGHKEFPENATECPGAFLMGKLEYIVSRAKEIYKEKYTAETPKPEPEQPSEPPVKPETPTTPQVYVEVKRSVLEALQKELNEAKIKIEASEIVINNLLGGK